MYTVRQAAILGDKRENEDGKIGVTLSKSDGFGNPTLVSAIRTSLK